MSFVEELRNKVIDTRKRIKDRAINSFTDLLKTRMRTVAERGNTRGSIWFKDFFEDDEDYDDDEDDARLGLDIIELNTLLNEEYRDFNNYEVYNWLLNQVKKSNIFDGIEIGIEKNHLEFKWYLTE